MKPTPAGATTVLPALDEYENTYREQIIPLAAKTGHCAGSIISV